MGAKYQESRINLLRFTRCDKTNGRRAAPGENRPSYGHGGPVAYAENYIAPIELYVTAFISVGAGLKTISARWR